MSQPRILITGYSGFIGRRLLECLGERWHIIGLARRPPSDRGIPERENLTWFQCDVGDRELAESTFAAIREAGGADVVVHLAAHYDFTGGNSGDYWNTNIQGMRHVLDGCRTLAPRKLIFASSAAACRFPPPGGSVDESSPADGSHIYAVTKRMGEEMLAEYADSFPSTIVRFAALFSDWCEHPPLFSLLRTWTSKAWNRRILAGRGESAIPYLHVRDAAQCLLRTIDSDVLDPGEVILASPSSAVSHRQLFDTVMSFNRTEPGEPILMPRPFCWLGLHVMDRLGRIVGRRPFERPWMARYIDRRLTVDPRHSWARLGWRPRSRLEIVRRLPFLVENLTTNPAEWYRRNQAAVEPPRMATNLALHRLLEQRETDIVERIQETMRNAQGVQRFPDYQRMEQDVLEWNIRVGVRSLLNAIRTRDRTVLASYCRDLAEQRSRDGYSVQQVRDAIGLLEGAFEEVLRELPEAAGLTDEFFHLVTMTLQFGYDQIEETFERVETREVPS